MTDDEKFRTIENRLGSLESKVASLDSRVARVEGIVDTIKWSIWLGFTLLGILISMLRLV